MKVSDIHSFMLKIAEQLGTVENPVLIRREDQTAPKEDKYPCATYKIIGLSQDPQGSASRFEEPIIVNNVESEEKFNEVLRKNQRASVSLSIIHPKSLATCINLADKAMDFVDSIEGLTLAETFGITPDLITGEIQDRTVPMDNASYIYKAGFDILLQGRKETKTEKPKMAPIPPAFVEET